MKNRKVGLRADEGPLRKEAISRFRYAYLLTPVWFPGSGQVQEADEKCTNSGQVVSSAGAATGYEVVPNFNATVFRDAWDGCYVPKTLPHWPDFLNSGKVILKYSETDDLEMIRPEKTNCAVYTAQQFTGIANSAIPKSYRSCCARLKPGGVLNLHSYSDSHMICVNLFFSLRV